MKGISQGVVAVTMAVAFVTGMACVFAGSFAVAPGESGVITRAWASSKTGLYKQSWYGSYNKEWKTRFKSSRSVRIKSIKNGKVTFVTTYYRFGFGSEATSNMIRAKLRSGIASFRWKEKYWGDSGTGKLKIGNGYVKIRVNVTKHGPLNPTLGTEGWCKLRKGSHKIRVR